MNGLILCPVCEENKINPVLTMCSKCKHRKMLGTLTPEELERLEGLV